MKFIDTARFFVCEMNIQCAFSHRKEARMTHFHHQPLWPWLVVQQAAIVDMISWFLTM